MQPEEALSEREQLERSIAALEAQRSILGDAVVDPAIAALHKELFALQAASAPEQRKQVTILFADVSGFTAMSETMDAEDVRDTMNDLWERLDGAIIAQGGMIDKHIGDCVMALFGAPTAHEDDPERAIRAALAMQEALAAFRKEREAELAMRIGINTGPVLLGGVGTTDEYTAMGDAVNLASRLEHAAPVGGILVSHDTYRHVRGVFTVQPQEPLQVKGKVEPIQTYVVQGARPRAFRVTTRGVWGIETRMIGREAELGQIQEALQAVIKEGEARVVTIVGEAGVGKSRLLYEFRSWLHLQLENVRIFRGRATPEMRNLPYSLIRDLFAFRFDIRDSDSAAVAREKLEQGIVALWGTEGAASEEKAHFIGQLIGFDFSESAYLRGIIGDARQIHDRAFHYAAQFFQAVTGDDPAAIYLEDIHWADDASLDLIDYLVWECRHAPLLTIALARPAFFGRRPSWGTVSAPFESVQVHIRIDLPPLSTQDSRRLVEEILRKVDQVPPDLQDLITRGAEGNPFYVEELIKMLIEDGVIVRESALSADGTSVVKGPERWQVEMERLIGVRVPETLTGVIQARLDGLPPSERETLQRASVVGRIFWDGAVERIYESTSRRRAENATSAALQALRSRELIFEQDASAFVGAQEYIFKHAILHDVTYESVLKRLRRIYHAQVAEWLIEQSGERVGEYAGRIGEHYEQAGETALAAEWYGRAGRRARETYALETALDFYQKALALEERWEWLKEQVQVLHILGQRDDEQAALKALEAEPEAPVFESAYLWGQHYEAIGEYPQAQATIERALIAYRESDDTVGQVRCLAQLGLTARRRGDYEGAKGWYNQALTLFHGQEIYSDEESQALARALNGLGIVYRQQGDFDQARVCYERALALNYASGNRRGEAEALNNLGGTAFYQRHFTEALAHYQQALEIWRAIGDRAGEGRSLYSLGQIIRDVGDYGQAQRHFSAALTIFQSTGDRWEEANVWNDLGILYHELGDWPSAQNCLEQGLQLTQEIGDEAGQAYLLVNLGLVMCDSGDLAAAEKQLADGLVVAQKQNDKRLVSSFLSYMSMVSLRAGKPEQAVERATKALLLRQSLGMQSSVPDNLAISAKAHLMIDDMSQALDYAQQALAILDEYGGEGPEFPQLDYFICYQVLAATGQEETARAVLQSAYDLVLARAAKITDSALRQSFLERVQRNREIVHEYEKFKT